MSTPNIPLTGPIKLGAIVNSFPNIGKSLSQFRGKHPSLPVAGKIQFSAFRGLSAVSPIHTLTTTSGTNINMNASGEISGMVGGSTSGVLNINLQNYLENINYQGALNYIVSSGTLPTGVTLSSGGDLHIDTTTSTNGNINIVIAATNSFGNSSSIPLSFNFSAATTNLPPVTSGLVSIYNGESWEGTRWKDVYGTNHATAIIGTINIMTNGINNKNYIYGGINASIQFPLGILPSTYTLFHVAKYNGINKGRIIVNALDGASAWISGFWAGNTGVAYHGSWINTTSIGAGSWVHSTDQNNMYRANGQQRGGTISGGSSANIGVNVYAGERSDWAIGCIIVYNRTLNLSEIQQVESYLRTEYGNYV